MKTKLLLGASLSVICLIGLAIGGQSGPRAMKTAGKQSGDSQLPPPPPPGFHPPNPLMVALDADKDGTLSAAEISGAPAALAKLDTNGDGKLTPDELRPPRPEPPKDGQGPKPGDQIMRLDTDKDGYVTFEEFTTPMKEVFSRIDTNKDNKIDKDEAAAAPPPPPGRGPCPPPPPPPPPPDSGDQTGAANNQ